MAYNTLVRPQLEYASANGTSQVIGRQGGGGGGGVDARLCLFYKSNSVIGCRTPPKLYTIQ